MCHVVMKRMLDPRTESLGECVYNRVGLTSNNVPSDLILQQTISMVNMLNLEFLCRHRAKKKYILAAKKARGLRISMGTRVHIPLDIFIQFYL